MVTISSVFTNNIYNKENTLEMFYLKNAAIMFSHDGDVCPLNSIMW